MISRRVTILSVCATSSLLTPFLNQHDL
ncbi:hypothetical protein GBAR_LOCUS3259 [Geodia barretti]|uniref:Uncharacterized protein n=1 Tax=Geodia barretti TaxID=519541 RepID=A0AA35R2X6_GEOBA|nr:hypothetical protein GBAR_LOCUS3259 [Geodia barretti]